MPATSGPLAGMRVVEWALDTPGSYCTKLLGDLGAEVIKIEEPEGDPIRRLGPFPGDVPDSERSAYFFFLNTNKSGVALDLRTAKGRGVLDAFLQRTDIFVTDCTVAALEQRRLTYEALSRANPGLIFTAITPFGLNGP